MQAFPRRSGPPAQEPVTLAAALAHLREVADGGEQDAYITGLISVAREAFEERSERTLVSTPWTLWLDSFPEAIELRQPPIIAVQSVTYVDEAGALQTLDPADYVLDSPHHPGWLVCAPGKSWPGTQLGAVNAVTVNYTAGYGPTAASVPPSARHWVLLAIRQMFDKRGEDLPPNFCEGFMNPFRIMGV